MAGREGLQLGVVLLFPLSYITFLLWTAGRHQGRSPREIVLTLAGILSCVLGIVTIGLVLNASRGHALLELTPHAGSGLPVPSPEVQGFRAVDGLGLLMCAGLLVLALRLARRLTHVDQPAAPEGDGPPE